MKHFLSLVSLVAVGLPAALYFSRASLSEHSGGQRSRSNALAAIRVQRLALPEHLKLAGKLLPLEQVEVISRLAGKLSEIRVETGDRVTAGNVVAVVHAGDLEERLARSHAAIRAAETELQARQREAVEAEQRATTYRGLAQRQLIARREMEEAEATADTARAAAELARAHLAQQQAMLAQAQALQALTILRAPITGQVVGRHLERGAAVAEGAAILTIGVPERLRLTARVGVAEALGVSLGAKARITSSALPDQIFEGQVSRVTAPANDGESFSEIEVRLDNHQRRLPIGMAVEAAIELDQSKGALVIPRAAVLSRHDSTYVYKVAGDRPIRQAVVVGRELGEQILVLSGLSESDSVIADPAGPSVPAVKEKGARKSP